MEEVQAAFRPEFLNRLDDVMLFERLQPTHMGAIVDIQMRRLDKLLAGRGLSLELSQAARGYLAEKGYDAAFGARPLKRVIQRDVQDVLAEEILQGKIGDDCVIHVDMKNDSVFLKAKKRAAMAH